MLRVLLVLLVASLIGNAYLAVAREHARSARHPAVTAHARETAAVQGQRASAARAELRADSACAHRLRLSARKLSDTQRQIASKLPFEDRFSRGQPDPASEVRLAHFMDEVFGDELAYTIECRSRICTLRTGVSIGEWMVRFQQEAAERALDQASQWGGPETFVEMLEEPRSRGYLHMWEVTRRIRRSSLVADCRTAHPAVGELGVKVELDANDQYSAEYRGSLVGSAFDVCARAAVTAELAAIPVPAEIVWPEDPRVVVLAE